MQKLTLKIKTVLCLVLRNHLLVILVDNLKKKWKKAQIKSVSDSLSRPEAEGQHMKLNPVVSNSVFRQYPSTVYVLGILGQKQFSFLVSMSLSHETRNQFPPYCYMSEAEIGSIRSSLSLAHEPETSSPYLFLILPLLLVIFSNSDKVSFSSFISP